MNSGYLRGAVVTLFLALAVMGCSDSVTEPDGPAFLEISSAPVAALEVGQTTNLSATALTRTGAALFDAAIAWNSLAPLVATVTQQGMVTAIAPGTADIVASSEGVADTVQVQVIPRPAASGNCSTQPAEAPFSVGESRSMAAGTSLLCLGGIGAEYILVAFNGSISGSTPLTFTGSGLTAPTTQASLTATPRLSISADGPDPDRAFEAGIRRRERQELPAYLGAVRASRSARGPSLAIAPALASVGDFLTLNVSTTACTVPKTRQGRVAAVTERAIVVHDTSNPAGGFTDAEYREIGLVFDNLVYPVGTENFGEPGDLDGNGRVIIFYTSAVNALTERNSDSYVGGFFYSRDLFPRTAQSGIQGCAGSNNAEMFYLLAPDPGGAVNGNSRSKDFVSDVTVTTIAHEFQHLISASRRLYVVKTDNFDEEVWLNEGLSHIAEELTFYRAAGLSPGQNLTADAIRASVERREAFNLYASSNFSRFQEYLESPETSSPFADDDELATRGAAWAFLRYAADRKGGDQSATWRALVNSSLTGFANVGAVLGSGPMPVFRDWTASLYLDDKVAGVPAVFLEPSWNFRSTFAAFTSGGGSYPLTTRVLGNGGAGLPVTLAGGGGSFIRFGVGMSIGQVRIASGTVAPPPTISLLVVRTR